MNAYLVWKTVDADDRVDRWEATLGLIDRAPKDACIVDVTPRRVQRFAVKPTAQVTWTNTSLTDGRAIQSGTATADEWGLITLPRVQVTKSGNRISIPR